MKIPAKFTNVNDVVQLLIRAFNGRINLTDNIEYKSVSITAPVTPNTEFAVLHNLGRVPITYIYNIDRSGTVYDSNRTTWTLSQMTLKCSVASAVITLIVL